MARRTHLKKLKDLGPDAFTDKELEKFEKENRGRLYEDEKDRKKKEAEEAEDEYLPNYFRRE